VNDGMIRTLWFWRKGEDGPEMLTAWDEFMVDENWQGWKDECDRVYALVREDDAGYGTREIHLRFPFVEIEKMFYPGELDAVVASNQERRPEA